MGFYRVWRDCCGIWHRVWREGAPRLIHHGRRKLYVAACACPKAGVIALPLALVPAPIPQERPALLPESAPNPPESVSSLPELAPVLPLYALEYERPQSFGESAQEVPEPAEILVFLTGVFFLFLVKYARKRKGA